MGERFGNYEILRKLAAGGMAEVLLAKHKSFGGFERLVCLKRILPHLSGQEEFMKMFQDEARIAANLVHPNVAQIYDIAEEKGQFYIAMEYVRGEDLRRIYNQEVARGNSIPYGMAALVTMGAAAALDYAHRHTALDGSPLGIVHRDVSPQNILVTFDGHVKLIDFGVAKAAGKLNQTRAGVLKGKYSYMSPEQASGDPLDGRTDIFALGITLYEITCGTRLFKRDNELETLHAVVACQVKPPSQVKPGYDPDLERIVLKSLAAEPERRYQTAGEFEHDLEQYLYRHGHPTSASALAHYLQDLFAEKLADEALFGGQGFGDQAGGRGQPAKALQTSSTPMHEGPNKPEHNGAASPHSAGGGAADKRTTGDAPAGPALADAEEQTSIDGPRVPSPLPQQRTPAEWRSKQVREETVASPGRDTGSSVARTQLVTPEGIGTEPPSPASAHPPARGDAAGALGLLPPGQRGAGRRGRWLAAAAFTLLLAAYLFQRGSSQAELETLPEGAADSQAAQNTASGSNRADEPPPAPASSAAATPAEVAPMSPGTGPQTSERGDLAGPAAGDGRSPDGAPAATEAPAAAGPLQAGQAAIDIDAPLPMTVTLGGHYLGETPLAGVPLSPGTLRFKLESKAEGLVTWRRAQLRRGQRLAVHVADERGELKVEGKPWVWLQRGLYPAAESPISVQLLAGDYTVHFECPDGRREQLHVPIEGNQTVSLAIDCEKASIAWGH